MNSEYKYHIALTFAGEDRNVARELANRLFAYIFFVKIGVGIRLYYMQ